MLSSTSIQHRFGFLLRFNAIINVALNRLWSSSAYKRKSVKNETIDALIIKIRNADWLGSFIILLLSSSHSFCLSLVFQWPFRYGFSGRF